MLRRQKAIAVAVLAGLAVGGCKDGGTSSADPTVPTAASSSSSTSTSAPAAPDVSTIPATIDETYLNAVLAALDEIDGQATRIIKSTKSFPPEAAVLLNAIYSDEAFDRETEVWLRSLARSPELAGIRPNPGNRRTIVSRIIAASPSCTWLAVRRDREAVNTDPNPDRIEYIALVPKDSTNDPAGNNPTPWMISADGFRDDTKEPSKPC